MSHSSDAPPEWYWNSGLHNACIESIEALEFPFDYNKFAEKNEYNRNLMTLKLNAKGALYDNTVKEIRFLIMKFWVMRFLWKAEKRYGGCQTGLLTSAITIHLK